MNDNTKKDLEEEIVRLNRRIEELKKALFEKKLSEVNRDTSEMRFRQAMISAPFPLMMYAEDGEVLILSRAWTDMSGYTIEDMPTVEEWLKKAMGTRSGSTIAYVDKLHVGNKRVEDGDYIITTKGGEKRVWYFNSAPIERLPDGRRVVVSIATDITDRRLAEKSLQETVWLLHMIIYKTGDGVTISDASGHFEVYNSRMQDITGYSIEEANSSGDFSTLIYPDQDDRNAAIQRLEAVIAGKALGEVETFIQAKDGSKKTLLVMSSVIRYKNREMYLSVYRDITERVQSNEDLKRLYKTLEMKNIELQKLDRLKDEFISTVSHEIRTPLSITKEGIDLVLEGIAGPMNDKQADILTTARTNINRLVRIISDLLDVSKMEAGKFEIKKAEIDLAALVCNAASLFGLKLKEKDLDLKMDIPAGSMIAMADSDMVMQVLTNLIDNAIKFTNKGHVGIRIRDKGDYIECSVSDTGIGISKENLPKVFSKFQQFRRTAGAGEKGTGLGLFIVKGIVEAHDGKVWVESTYGMGARFTFVLPKR